MKMPMVDLVKYPRSVLRALRVKTQAVHRYIVHPGMLRLRSQIRLLSTAAIIKRRLNPHVTYVGITGSAGKTTTAMLISKVLAERGECLSNISQNGVRSVARSVLAVRSSTKFSVQEICGAKPGKVRLQTRLLRPDIAVITTVGSDHYRSYRSLEATAKEKGSLAEAVPDRGKVLLNADDPNVRNIASRCRAQVLTYGLSPDADVRGSEVSSAWPDRLALTVTHGDRSVRVSSQLIGEHWTTSILAAMACGIVCDLDLETCAEAIADCVSSIGRYSVHPVSGGPVYVLDYKASIWTIASALAFIGEARATRTTIVFGTISDYPGAASKNYRRVARQALAVADRVVFVGPQSALVSKLRQGEMQDKLSTFQTCYEAAESLGRDCLPGELILLKGSVQADHLERIVLAQTEGIVCWKQACGRMLSCPDCPDYRKPSPPPFGLVKRVKPDATPRAGDTGHGIQLPPAS